MAKGLPSSGSSFFRRRPALSGFLFGMAGVAVVMGLSFTQLLRALELKAYDRFMQIRCSPPVSDRIVMVDIDDASIDEIGEFPFVRSHYAAVVDLLREAGARQILFDITFPNPSHPTAAAGESDAAPRIVNHDELFAEALERARGVYLPFTLDTTYLYSPEISAWFAKARAALWADIELDAADLANVLALDAEQIRRREWTLKRRAVREYMAQLDAASLKDKAKVMRALLPHWRPGYVSPEAALVEAERRRELGVRRIAAAAALPASHARGLDLPSYKELSPPEWLFAQHLRRTGYVNAEPDPLDGSLRRVQLAMMFRGRVYLQIALRAALDWLGADPAAARLEADGLHFQAGAERVFVPTDRSGAALVNWVARDWAQTFRHIPFAKIVELGEVRRVLERNLAALDARYFRGRRARLLADPKTRPEQVRAVEEELLEFLAENVRRGKAMAANARSPQRAAAMRKQIKAIESDLLVVREQRRRAAALAEWLRGAAAGRICIIGDTSTSSTDLHPTPVSTQQPGVTLHANVINMILQRRFLREAPRWVNLLLIAFWGLANTFASLWGGAGRNATRTAALTFSSAGVAFLLFAQTGVFVAVFGPFFAQVTAFAAVTIMRQFTEERSKREIRYAFEHYLSPEVVDLVAEDPSRLALGGEKRELTILFSDIQGFSTISEGLDEQALVEWLNEYLGEMSQTIIDAGGVVDKYEGDLIMAFFGAPQDMPDHAVRACLATLENQRKLAALRPRWEARGLPPVFARVGLNTGQALVGNLGSKTRLNYSIIGDEVNIAARLEPANKAFGTYTMISEATYRAAQDAIVARELDLIRVVGRWRPIRVYELIGKKGEVSPDVLKGIAAYEEGLAYYRERRWSEAVERFTRAQEIVPGDPPSQMMMARCGEYLVKPPPEDWDGVFNLQSKE